MSGIPTYIEPRIGWRTWSLRVDGGEDAWAITGIDQGGGGPPSGQFELVTGSNTVWPAYKRLEARCAAGQEHGPPDVGCRCGIYAAVDLETLRAMGYAAGPGDEDYAADVVGEVAMWGRMIENDNILRAEYAYPKRLTVPYTRMRWAKPLGAAYGVPVNLCNPFTMREEGR